MTRDRRWVDADDEFLAPTAWKLHFKLAPVFHLSPRAPLFSCVLLVQPLTDPDGALAQGLNRVLDLFSYSL